MDRNDKIKSTTKHQRRTSKKCFSTADAQYEQLQDNQETVRHAAKDSHPAVS